jgi:hypothetical protein
MKGGDAIYQLPGTSHGRRKRPSGNSYDPHHIGRAGERKSGSQQTRSWRRQSRANPSLEARIPCYPGKYSEFSATERPSSSEARIFCRLHNGLQSNSLTSRTGKFLSLNRERN